MRVFFDQFCIFLRSIHIYLLLYGVSVPFDKEYNAITINFLFRTLIFHNKAHGYLVFFQEFSD
ncbi:hypothetical protein DV009_25080 [Vibrio parahaemolyticus]|nr:hypothetical protein FORC71_4207 [Vibrio parahaemolyticus]USN27310.1 hypothetical protein [synthetic construct]EGR0735508.1 hypothetical protein [Vibrio parahaemolyticus]EGR0766904.1 hypothetical protein [Vibrio parahaemolyticus]EGR0998168.1 hypothetical protein [Vibrio parahaemolyticus]